MDAWNYNAQATEHRSAERWEQVIIYAQRAIEVDPMVSWFHFHQGEAYVKLAQWELGAAALERAIDLEPSFAWAHYFLAVTQFALGQDVEAVERSQIALELAPSEQYLQSYAAYASHLAVQDQFINQFLAKPRTNRLRLLQLTPYQTYPPKQGGITRMFHEMRSLSKHFEVVVVSFLFTESDLAMEKAIAPYCELSLGVMPESVEICPENVPATVHQYKSRRMSQILQRLVLADFDIVVIDFIYMAQYRSIFEKSFTVLAEHNIESELLRRCAEVNQGSMQEALLLAKYEKKHWNQFDLRFVVSAQDQRILDRTLRDSGNEQSGNGRTIVVSNGIDTRSVQPLPDHSINRIIFIGTLNYFPNIDGVTYFIQQILPLIWQVDPLVEFWVAGANPVAELVNLVDSHDRRVRVIANPEDMTDVARQCCMSIVPLRAGSGTRIKIIHAMAMGLPIVSTSLGCEGLEISHNEHLLIADTPEEFAQATLLLLQDKVLRDRLRQSARERSEERYDWDCIFEEAIGELMNDFEKKTIG